MSTDGRYGTGGPALKLTRAEALEKAGLGWFQCGLGGVCGIFLMADAMEMMIIGMISPAIKCEFDMTQLQMALLTSVIFAGFFAGNAFWGAAADWWGRKWVVTACSAITGCLGVACSVAPSYPWLVALRGLVGFGIGGIPVAFALNTELLPEKDRSRVGGMLWIFWGVGSCAETGLAYVVVPALGWRWLVALSSLPMLTCLMLSCWLPESPGWLACKGRTEETKEVILRVATANGTLEALGNFEIVEDAKKADEEGGDDAKENVAESVACSLLRGTQRVVIPLALAWFTSMALYYGTTLIQSEMIQAIDSGERCPAYDQTSETILPAAPGTETVFPKENASMTMTSALLELTTPEYVWTPAAQKQAGGAPHHMVRITDSFVQVYTAAKKRASGELSPGDVELTDGDKAQRVCSLKPEEYIEMLGSAAGDGVGWALQQAIASSALFSLHHVVAFGGMWTGLSYFVFTLGCPGRTIEAFLLLSLRGAGMFTTLLMWTITADIFPDSVRGTALGSLSAIGRLGCIATGFVSEALTHYSWSAAFGTYCVCGIVLMVAMVCLPAAVVDTLAPSSLSALRKRLAR